MTIEAPPPRDSWPDPPARTEAGEVLTDLIIGTFRLNARLLDVAQELAGAGGLTAAWWQVLGGVIDRPRTVAEIGRNMGMTRQVTMVQHPWADGVGAAIGADELRTALQTMRRLVDVLEAEPPSPG